LLIVDIIRKKRDGAELTAEEISFFVAGLADGSIPAEQVSALAMAIFLNSMTAAEAGRLTLDMAASGTVLDWRNEDLDGPVVDKHSTGGVGDKVSFLLAGHSRLRGDAGFIVIQKGGSGDGLRNHWSD
jgi:thymidine phosphorylase